MILCSDYAHGGVQSTKCMTYFIKVGLIVWCPAYLLQISVVWSLAGKRAIIGGSTKLN